MKNADEYYYTGIKKFMASPYVSLDEVSNYDIGVIGVPIDFGSSYRLGAKYGPKAIRDHSFMDRIASGKYYDLDTNKWIQGNKLSICDLGDINIHPTNPEKNIEEVINTVTAIRKTSFPVILGGDHSITYSTFKACASILKNKKIGLVHFDAHLDTEDDYLPTLPKIWHGNPFSSLIEEGLLDGERMVTIGVRGRINETSYNYTKKHGITLYTAKQVKQKGVAEVISEVIKKFEKDTDYIFLTVDIDCIDMGQAPGTGTPKYGGLDVEELIHALIMMKDLPVIGMDIVEVNPLFDPTESTPIIAGELLYNYLSFGFNKNIQSKI